MSPRARIAAGAAIAAIVAFGAVGGAAGKPGTHSGGAKHGKKKHRKPKPVNFFPRTELHFVAIQSTTEYAGGGVLMGTRPKRPGCIANRWIEVHVFGKSGDRLVTTTAGIKPENGERVILVGVGFTPQPGDAAFYLYVPAKQAGPYNCSAAQTAIVPLPAGAGEN